MIAQSQTQLWSNLARAWFLKSLLNLFQYCFCFTFWFLGLKAYEIAASQPGMDPAPPTLEGNVLPLGSQASPSLPLLYGEDVELFTLWNSCLSPVSFFLSRESSCTVAPMSCLKILMMFARAGTLRWSRLVKNSYSSFLKREGLDSMWVRFISFS